MNKRAECIRTVANWSIADKEIAYDHASFNEKKMLELIPIASPKMEALFKKIRELDETDMQDHGKLFKHMIFTDIKSSAYGAKLLAGAFKAKGYKPAYGKDLVIDEGVLRRTENNNFALLCSTVIWGRPLGARFRKKILDVFNSRPMNVQGELIRFIILDQGFKEGIDLYDIKYIHLFEPLLTTADEKQAVGRGTRLCGQKGLEFDPKRGWPLFVYRYEVGIPDQLQDKYNTSRMFDLFLRESGIDMRKLVFASTLETMSIYGAVDHDLTKNVHQFNIRSHDEPSTIGVRSLLGIISGGVRKKKNRHSVHKRVNAPRGKKTFEAMREYIKERFAKKYTWPAAKLENQCVTHGGTDIVEFNPTQNFVRMFFQPHSGYKGMLLWHSTGTGKCHAKDTPILMFDGSIKMVQDIQVGDMLMGDDSTPRKVLSLARGEDEMYDIIPQRGDTYRVNSEHIVVLKDTEKNDIVEIEVRDLLKLDPSLQRALKGIRTGVEFAGNHSITPIGTWESHIPREYLINSRDNRLTLLKYIIDADGFYNEDAECYEIKAKSDRLTKDILFLARSLGFAAYVEDGCIAVYGYLNENQKEDMLVTSIKIAHAGKGEYYGFTLDGNNRYLLGDFTITHNTCSAVATASTSWERQGYTILWVTRHTLKPDIWKNMYKQVCSLVIRDKIRHGELPENAIKTPLKYTSKAWVSPLSYKQFSNMLAGKNAVYDDMVKRNGADDLLKKTLIIIDEAHKLFADDTVASEKPDVDLIYKSILDSYDKSGAESARVLLMTATPYTSDPMHMIKLMNLMRPRAEAMKEEFGAFAEEYLESNGKFSVNGHERFLNDIAGYISYLNREKDARQFSYPIFENIVVPMTSSDRAAQQRELDALTARLTETDKNVKEGTNAVKKAKDKVRDDRARLLKECDKLPTAKEKKACKDEVKKEMARFEKELLTDLNAKLVDDKKAITQLKTLMKDKKKKLGDKKADFSQEAALQTRCNLIL